MAINSDHRTSILDRRGNQLIIDVRRITDLSDKEIIDMCLIKEQFWPYSIEEQLRWWDENSDKTDVLLQIYSKQELIAFLRIRMRNVSINSSPAHVRCVTEVCVSNNRAKSGIGTLLINAAKELINSTDNKFGYLLCDSGQYDFYNKCGWVNKKNIAISSHVDVVTRKLKENVHCFVSDPLGLCPGNLVLFGSTF